MDVRELTFPATVDRLREVRDFVEAAAAECGFPEGECYQIKFAVNESVSNAIEHGSPPGGEHEITVRCRPEGAEFVVTVTDRGRFDPPVGGAPPPPERGRGLSVMGDLMDSVQIGPGEAGTVVRLAKRLPAGA